MIINGYSLAALLLCLVRLFMSCTVLTCAMRGMRRCQNSSWPSPNGALNSSGHLLTIAAVTLLTLAVTGWLLFYFVLQSYVPEWPEVMCVYGVTQVGRNATGLAGWMPSLIWLMQLLKPALIFVGGCWVVAHCVWQASRGIGAAGSLLRTAMLLGVLGAVDAATESLYLTAPKTSPSLAVGCCAARTTSQTVDLHSREGLVAPRHRSTLVTLTLSLNVILLAGLVVAATGWIPWSGSRSIIFGLCFLLSVPLNLSLWTEVLSPTLLGLPYHRCPYDLVPRFPETSIGLLGFVAAVLCVGWASVATFFALHGSSRAASMQRQLYSVALTAWGGCLVFFVSHWMAAA